jgi:hypothetical protein
MYDDETIAKMFDAMKKELIDEQREGQKRAAAAFVTLSVFWIAERSGMSWWELAMIVAMTYWGLHQLAGVKINWWG